MQLQGLVVVVFVTAALALPPRAVKLGKRDLRDWACGILKTGLLVNEFRFVDVDPVRFPRIRHYYIAADNIPKDVKWAPGREFLNDVAGCEDARTTKVELTSSIWATGTIFGITDEGRCGPIAAPASGSSLPPGIYQRINDESQFDIVQVVQGNDGEARVEEVKGQSPIPSTMAGEGPQYCYDVAGRAVQDQRSRRDPIGSGQLDLPGAVQPVSSPSSYRYPGNLAQRITQRRQGSNDEQASWIDGDGNNQLSEESRAKMLEQLRRERVSNPSPQREYQSSATIQNPPTVVVETEEDSNKSGLGSENVKQKGRWSQLSSHTRMHPAE